MTPDNCHATIPPRARDARPTSRVDSAAILRADAY